VRARTRHLSIYLSISSTATCLDAEVAALVIQRYERGRVARAAMPPRWRERWRAQQRGSQAAAKLKREQDARQEDWLASTAHHPKR
jgi:hypothetical protein